MLIKIDIIDSGCDLRRRRLAIHAEETLYGIYSHPVKKEAEIPVEWRVRDFVEVTNWLRTFDLEYTQGKGSPSLHLVFLHSSEPYMEEVVKAFADTIHSLLGERARLITYSGGPEDPISLGGELSSQQQRDWWNNVPKSYSSRDPDANLDEVGDRPDVRMYIMDILGLNQGVDNKKSPRRAKSEERILEMIRHDVFNGLIPLRHAAQNARDLNRPFVNFSKFWPLVRRRLNRHLESLPEWIERTLETIEKDVAPRLDDERSSIKALNELVVNIEAIEGYVRSLGGGKSLEGIASSELRDSWGEEKPRVLWIDDIPEWYEAVKEVFERAGIILSFTSDIEAAVNDIQAVGEFDAVVLDIILEGFGLTVHNACKEADLQLREDITDENAGLGLLQLIQLQATPPPVFVLSARQSPHVIHACTRYGAAGYLTKSDADFPLLLTTLYREISARRERLLDATTPLNPRLVVGDKSDPLRNIMYLIDRISQSGSRGPVFFWGEPGCGKEELAWEMQLRSHRRNRPFVRLRCQETNLQLAEDYFFGHERGAFTGADRAKEGPFEHADGGTVLIDEIDKVSQEIQNKLLSIIADQSVARLGANAGDRKTIDNVLLIFSSNINPVSEEGGKAFGNAFISRVRKFLFQVPALKDRSSAVAEIAKSIIRRICDDLKIPLRRLDEGAVSWLRNEAVSGRFEGDVGNIRGLYHLLERCIIYCPDENTITRGRLLEVDEAGSAIISVEDEALRRAAREVATFLEGKKSINLNQLEDRFRAYLFLSLANRGISRKEMQELFGQERSNLDHKIGYLKKRGFIPPDAEI